MDLFRLVGYAERPARFLRRHRLNRPVDAVRRLAERRMGGFTVEVDGLDMSGATVGHRKHLESVRRGGKEHFMSELFTSRVREGMVVVDLGAYLGYFTLLAARGVGPTGHVYAFEPNRRLCELLLRNVQANGYQDRVTVKQTAIADTSGEGELYVDTGDESTSSLVAPTASARPQLTSVTTLDDYLPAGVVVDALKIDIEGGEPRALRGMRQVIARASPDLQLFVECNPGALEHAGSSTDELFDLLESLGLQALVIDEEAHDLVRPDDATMRGGYVNLYCTRRR